MENRLLSEAARSRIDREIAKFPSAHKRSAVIAALAIAQDEHGWLSAEVMDEVARHLGIAPVAVYEVASFYAMFELKPTGRFKLTICTNLPCALSGAAAAAEHLKQKLGIGFGETTGDGKFTLKEGECFGACGDAPVLLVNNKKMESFMNPPALDRLLDELSAAADRGEGPSRAASSTPLGGSAAREPDGPPRGRASEREARSTSSEPQAWGDHNRGEGAPVGVKQ
jgi:NADH-quinone oxidoreductase subunit E